jgi:hypothetical protein
MSRRSFAIAMILGAILRAAALPLPGTLDVDVWKIWTYNATLHGVSRLYGVGGAPPERRLIEFHGAQTVVDYPPLALYELDGVGHLYRAVMHHRFPDTVALTAMIKGTAAVAEAGFALIVFFTIWRLASVDAARWAVAAYWLNPASILDASVLGYLDPLFVLPAVGALVAAASSWPLLAGGLMAAAVLTKAQAIFVAPAVALMVWTAGEPSRGVARVAMAAAGACGVAAIVVAPVVAVGAWPNMIGALQSLLRHNMLSANACNLWWIVGYVMRAFYSSTDMGVWAAFSTPTRILGIARVRELGYPNTQLVGGGLALAAFAWALLTARGARGLWMGSALAAFLVHAYTTLSVQVHENHLFAAIPFLAIAAAGRRRYVPVFVLLSAIFALNLNLFYGMGESVGYLIPRTLTIVDMTVLLAILNCATLAWHATVFRVECSVPEVALEVPLHDPR